MSIDLMDRFQSNWLFVRGLTRDLLQSLDPADLEFSPGKGVGSVWKHFRHLGRVQENYLHAMETGTISFGLDGASYTGGPSKENLLKYLERLDSNLNEMLKATNKPGQTIHWFGEEVELGIHWSRMTEHEVLHQGMLVVYVRLLNRKFPASWRAWGL